MPYLLPLFPALATPRLLPAPGPRLLPARLVQAPALLPALLFLDDAAPHQACRCLSRTLYVTHQLLPSKPSQAVWLTY